VPKLASGQLNGLAHGQGTQDAGPSRRIASQTAAVFNAVDGRSQESSDGLNLGMHYVNTLGENLNHATGGKEDVVPKVMVTAGEEFKFRIKVAIHNSEYGKLDARLTSGARLPSFLRFDPMSQSGDSTTKRAVEFYGVADYSEIGEYSVGIYAVGNTEALASVIVKVRGRGAS
jgi:axial budding pattern protein 2